MHTTEDASTKRSGLDGGLQLFASDIDDREGGGDAIKSERRRKGRVKIERERWYERVRIGEEGIDRRYGWGEERRTRKRNLPLNSSATRGKE